MTEHIKETIRKELEYNFICGVRAGGKAILDNINENMSYSQIVDIINGIANFKEDKANA